MRPDPDPRSSARRRGARTGEARRRDGASAARGERGEGRGASAASILAVAGILLHSADYLELSSIWVLGWQWLIQATAARAALTATAARAPFYEGKLAAAQYRRRTELPRIPHPASAPRIPHLTSRIPHLAVLCRDAEESYGRMRPDWF